MRRIGIGDFLLMLLIAAPVFAAGPAATAGASAAFVISGVTVPQTAAASVTVVVGDEVSALEVPVHITFADRSRIVLDRDSSVRLSEGKVQLLKGAVRYQLAEKSGLSLSGPS